MTEPRLPDRDLPHMAGGLAPRQDLHHGLAGRECGAVRFVWGGGDPRNSVGLPPPFADTSPGKKKNMSSSDRFPLKPKRKKNNLNQMEVLVVFLQIANTWAQEKNTPTKDL